MPSVKQRHRRVVVLKVCSGKMARTSCTFYPSANEVRLIDAVPVSGG